MPMNLSLAVTLECLPTECQVQPLDHDEAITVNYSPAVQANIKIFPGQLVALDNNPTPPEIVFRWHYVAVKKLAGDKVVLEHRGQLAEATLVPGLDVQLQPGDQVFATLGGQSEIVDTAVDGRPAHPDFVSRYALPMVEEFYRKRAAQA